MKNDLISVIIPVYNAEKYLSECLRSVADQTYGNLEIILVDDGSADSSPEICRGFADKDSRFRIVRSDENGNNKGLPAARNKGLSVMTGDYFFFLDSDDFLDRNALKKMHAIARKKNTNIVICSNYVYIEGKKNDRSKFTDRIIKISDTSALQLRIFSGDICKAPLNSDNYSAGTAWGKLFSSKIKEKNINFNEKIRNCGGEDNIFSLYAYENEKSVYWVDTPLLYYRRGIKSKVNSFSDNTLEHNAIYIKAFDEFVNKYKKHDRRFIDFKSVIRANSMCVFVLRNIFYKYSEYTYAQSEIMLNSLYYDKYLRCVLRNPLKIKYLNLKKKILLICIKFKQWHLLKLIAFAANIKKTY